eukprot:NODE_6116_length_530_cov_54.823285_g5359_i0.p6 GENE.NODE_6116_length_530_cov_54.823285_g5359_i0~~NODE_6116_length_530_cov_54.823285_g5359_i0.p6  ORF type:complete len:55 (+),score=20.49 NODE_6116_length_530_cov_54.823285_g5359_i0:214-378(+)
MPVQGCTGQREPLSEDHVVECTLTANTEATLSVEHELMAFTDHLKTFVAWTKEV